MTNKTLKDWARLALAVQSASNLSGVVHSYSQFYTWLYQNPGAYVDTNALNQHPLSQLFAAQVLWLTTGTLYPPDVYAKAYEAAQEWAR